MVFNPKVIHPGDHLKIDGVVQSVEACGGYVIVSYRKDAEIDHTPAPKPVFWWAPNFTGTSTPFTMDFLA